MLVWRRNRRRGTHLILLPKTDIGKAEPKGSVERRNKCRKSYRLNESQRGVLEQNSTVYQRDHENKRKKREIFGGSDTHLTDDTKYSGGEFHKDTYRTPQIPWNIITTTNLNDAIDL